MQRKMQIMIVNFSFTDTGRQVHPSLIYMYNDTEPSYLPPASGPLASDSRRRVRTSSDCADTGDWEL